MLSKMVLAQNHDINQYYIFNYLAINPAFAGSSKALSATLIYRNQWVGFSDAPTTKSVTIHSPLRKQKMGVGLNIISDNINVSNETSIMGNYAYYVDFRNSTLALGLGVGLRLRNTQWTELEANDIDDYLIQSNSPTYINPDVSLGIYYTRGNYHLGFSIPYLLNHEFDSTKDKYVVRNDSKYYQYLISGDYSYQINSKSSVLLGSLITLNHTDKINIISNFRFTYLEKYAIGLAYDSEQCVYKSILQVQLNRQLTIGYSLDINNNAISKYQNVSHEFMLRYNFGYVIKVSSPRNF